MGHARVRRSFIIGATPANGFEQVLFPAGGKSSERFGAGQSPWLAEPAGRPAFQMPRRLLGLREAHSSAALLADRGGGGSLFRLTPQRLVHDVRSVMPHDGHRPRLDNGMYKIWFARNYRTRRGPTTPFARQRASSRPWGAGICRRPSRASLLNPQRRGAGSVRRWWFHDELTGDGDRSSPGSQSRGARSGGQCPTA